MADETTKGKLSVNDDPNFAVICSFITRYGALLDLPEISFDDLEKWIEDSHYVNSLLKDLLLKLMKRWKKSVNCERFQQHMVKFCQTYSAVDAWELEQLGCYERCNTAVKLRILKNLLEQQFDSHQKFKEKINEIPVTTLRCMPIGRDLNGKAYWFLTDTDMNMRIYAEEQDDVQNETWQMVVRDRVQLAELIEKLQGQKAPKEEEPSRPAMSTSLPIISDTVKDEVNTEAADTAVDYVAKVKAEPSMADDATSSVHSVSSQQDVKVKVDVVDSCQSKLSLAEKPDLDEIISNVSAIMKRGSVHVKVERLVCGIEKTPAPDDIQDDSTEVKSEVQQEVGQTDVQKNNMSSSVCTALQKNDACTGELTVNKSVDEGEDSSVSGPCEGTKDRNSVSNVNLSSKTTSAVDGGSLVPEAAYTSAPDTDGTPVVTSVDGTLDCKQTGVELASNGGNHASPRKVKRVMPLKLKLNADTVTVSQKSTLSTKRKRGCTAPLELSSASEDVPSTPLSESELSETLSESKDDTAANEEPPSKRMRDKALKTVAARDRRSNRSKTMPITTSSTCSSGNEAVGTEKDAGKLPQTRRDNLVASAKPRDTVEDGLKPLADKLVPEISKLRRGNVERKRDDVQSSDEDVVPAKSKKESAVCDDTNDVKIAQTRRGRCKRNAERSNDISPTSVPCGELVNGLDVEQAESTTFAAGAAEKCEDAVATSVDSSELHVNEGKHEVQSSDDDVVPAKSKKQSASCDDVCNAKRSRTGRLLNNAVTEKTGPVVDENPTNTSNAEQVKSAVIDADKCDATAPSSSGVISEVAADSAVLNKNQGKTKNAAAAGRGKKKRGRPPATQKIIPETNVTQGGETEYEPTKKIGRPAGVVPDDVQTASKTDDVQAPSKKSSKSLLNAAIAAAATAAARNSPAENDIPLIELRRSLRANKGRRTFEPIVADEPRKKQRAEAEKAAKAAQEQEAKARKAKEQAEAEEEEAARNKKKRRTKDDSDDDFVPGVKAQGKKSNGRGKQRQKKSDIVATSETESDDLLNDDDEASLQFGPSSTEEELESDGSEYLPTGRNAKRAAAIRSKEVHEENTFPCSKCGKCNHPECILLCDVCDAGYHTACLRPPLMLIPEGDWFCPPCEHNKLIERLREQLSEYDKKAKQNVRLFQRKQRLAYVGISLDNIIPDGEDSRTTSHLQDGELYDDERSGSSQDDVVSSTGSDNNSYITSDSDDDDADYGAKPRTRPQQRRRNHRPRARAKRQRRRPCRYDSDSEDSLVVNSRQRQRHRKSEDSEESGEDQWLTTRRSRRQHKQISYKFDEFDALISGAIEDDVKQEQGAGNLGRGKDISNITGVPDDDDDDDDGRPSPVGKRKKKKVPTATLR